MKVSDIFNKSQYLFLAELCPSFLKMKFRSKESKEKNATEETIDKIRGLNFINSKVENIIQYHQYIPHKPGLFCNLSLMLSFKFSDVFELDVDPKDIFLLDKFNNTHPDSFQVNFKIEGIDYGSKYYNIEILSVDILKRSFSLIPEISEEFSNYLNKESMDVLSRWDSNGQYIDNIYRHLYNITSPVHIIDKIEELPYYISLLNGHIKEIILNGFKEELLTFESNRDIFSRIEEYNKSTDDYSIKNNFAHVIDLVDGYVEILNSQELTFRGIKFHKRIVKFNFETSNQSIEINNKSIDILYELAESMNRFKSENKCKIDLNLSNGIVLIIEPDLSDFGPDIRTLGLQEPIGMSSSTGWR